jgi:hypothetical protein
MRCRAFLLTGFKYFHHQFWLVEDRSHIILSDVHDDTALAASVQISSIEYSMIDNLLKRSVADLGEEPVYPRWRPIPQKVDEVSSVMAGVSPLLDNKALYERLQARSDLGKFQVSIGSTHALGSQYLVDDDNDSTAQDPTDSDTNDEDDGKVLDDYS